MTRETSISISLDSELKERTEEILADLGMTLSEAFILMLNQISARRSLPFDVEDVPRGDYVPNAETLALLDRIESGEAEMAGPFYTFEDYKAWLDADDDDEV
ncbi:MAG: type II toxin-antitoxin system RelB/DinJ family antitoxin [Oscillospiraceae bacterium]|nr:type II toxin-antitoxin system RelB/DinJ family antitoxin [Oscillospiraceae bacterium]